MSTIVLTQKAKKLMKLCELEGYKRIHDLLNASMRDSLCPAICMTEGCDHTTEMESDQDAGYCEVCGGQTMVSAAQEVASSSRRCSPTRTRATSFR